MRKSALAFALASVLTTGLTEAHAVDGNTLQDWCQNAPSIALYYLNGVVDAYNVASPPIEFCIPDEVTLKQLRDVTCKWINNYPEERHKSAAMWVPFAWSNAWSCP